MNCTFSEVIWGDFTFWGRSRWLADACRSLLWVGTVGVGGRLPNNLKKMENIVFVLNYERHWINERLKLLFFKLANLNRERLDRGPWQQTTGWHWVPAENCDQERRGSIFLALLVLQLMQMVDNCDESLFLYFLPALMVGLSSWSSLTHTQGKNGKK